MSGFNESAWVPIFAITALKSTAVLSTAWITAAAAARPLGGVAPPGVDRSLRGAAGVAIPVGVSAAPARGRFVPAA